MTATPKIKNIITHANRNPILENMPYDVTLLGGASFTITNMALALGELSSGHRVIVDLRKMHWVRAYTYVSTVGTATAVIRIKFGNSPTTAIADTLSLIPTGNLEFSLAATGFLDSGWQPIAEIARITEIYIRTQREGGDGVLDPVITNLHIQFK